MIFYKSISCGNDFLLVDINEWRRWTEKRPIDADQGETARNLCDRTIGIGADGLVFYTVQGESAGFDIFNRDGSAAELSGNGMAGLSALLFFLGRSGESITLRTRSGDKTHRLLSREGNLFKLKIEIGEPDFQDHRFFPFLTAGQPCYRYREISFYPVSVGNPQAVVLLEKELTEAEMMAIGQTLEGAAIFPQRTNVGLVLPVDGGFVPGKRHIDQCRVFFYERGVGVTVSSSTGSAGVYAVLRSLGLVKERLAIHTPLESIEISGEEKIYIENFTRIVYQGNYLG